MSNLVSLSRISVKWGQKGTIAKYCPNNVVGCSPLACATAMSYIEYPTSLDITFPGAPVNHVDFDWYLIKAGWNDEALALLCRELGYRMGSDYVIEDDENKNSTGTDITNMLSVMLNILGNHVPTVYSGSGWDESLYPHKYIRESGVMVTNGYTNHTGGFAHTFVIDGFKFYHYAEYLYKVTENTESTGKYTPKYTYELVEVLKEEEENLIHIKWGWNGFDDGYFKGNLIANQQGESYDEQLHTSSNYIFHKTNFFTVK